MRNNCHLGFANACIVLFLSCVLHAEQCSVEIKLLLSPPTIQAVIASLGFEKETVGQVYFFDTDALDLQKQGVIVRVRQGAANDLTVKVRVPEDTRRGDISRLRAQFPCEINRTGAGEDTDYSIKRKYKALSVPETGADILKLLSPPQKELLHQARVPIGWSQVKKISDIRSTSWESPPRPPFGKLALEQWTWPEGNIIEISAKVEPGAMQAQYEELQRLMNREGLSLSERQGSKTTMVLDAFTHRKTPVR